MKQLIAETIECMRIMQDVEEVGDCWLWQGMAQRAQNWLVIPLCPSCHTGPRGIHGDKSVLRQIKKDEIDLLAETIGAMNAQTR